eukprot:TRINITY_DN55399_c0_g1_i1.p1 TRINITY_DN55399_c0_g1~~TRINITY_DN55399_c0_g1_i1.p1  ORF type:complete len:655 (-),score=72.93 TRINITY_DN55399_c0_g1_i1:157-2121(-)
MEVALAKRALGRQLLTAKPALLYLVKWAVYVFAPDVFGRQLALLIGFVAVRRLLWSLRRFGRKVVRSTVSQFSSRIARRESLRAERRRCKDYESFSRVSEELDVAEGKDAWKREANSRLYDAALLQARIRKYEEAQRSRDVEGCMFALRGELLRKHFGICNPALFEVCNTGTKHLVEDYVTTVCQTMNWLAFSHRDQARGADSSDVTLAAKLAFFQETKHSFGRSALLLSGGASLGMYHFGVIKTLHTNCLLPRILAGTSAGSIVCGTVATRTDEELAELWAPDFDWGKRFNLSFFEGPNWKTFVQKGGHNLFSTEKLAKAMRDNIGEWTFLEAYDRTGRICNITVSGLPGSTRYPMLLNYLTSPQVLIWSAAVASCSLPGIFEPQELLAKDRYGRIVPYMAAGLKWQDGSMQSDLPMTRLAELFNVNFFIVSQVNPQARLFSGGGLGRMAGPIFRTAQFLRRQIKQYLLSVAELGLGTGGRHVNPWLRPVGYTPVGLIAQEYQGDITIFNGGGMLEVPNLLNNGSTELMRRFIPSAEWETWWYIPQIKSACAIEFVMDEIIRELQQELLKRGSHDTTAMAKRLSRQSSLLDVMRQQDTRMPHEGQNCGRVNDVAEHSVSNELACAGLKRALNKPAALSSSQSLLNLMAVGGDI